MIPNKRFDYSQSTRIIGKNIKPYWTKAQTINKVILQKNWHRDKKF
jgi:hypothetical protein